MYREESSEYIRSVIKVGIISRGRSGPWTNVFIGAVAAGRQQTHSGTTGGIGRRLVIGEKGSRFVVQVCWRFVAVIGRRVTVHGERGMCSNSDHSMRQLAQ
jgi:hypothetical protein